MNVSRFSPIAVKIGERRVHNFSSVAKGFVRISLGKAASRHRRSGCFYVFHQSTHSRWGRCGRIMVCKEKLLKVVKDKP